MSTPPKIKVKFVDATGHFGKTASIKVDKFTIHLIEENDQKARGIGHCEPPQGHAATDDRACAAHWTAGLYNQAFDGYHVTFCWDPATKTVYIVKCLEWGELGKHLWGRNSGFFGFSLAAMFKASPRNYGNYPATPEQLEVMAQFIAEFCAWKRINPLVDIKVAKKESNASRIWTVPGVTTIKPVIDHAAIARADGYADHRWDIGTYYPKFFDRVTTIYRELKGAKTADGGTRTFEFEEYLK